MAVYCRQCKFHWINEGGFGQAYECCGIPEVFSSPTQAPRWIKGHRDCCIKNKHNDCKDYSPSILTKIITWLRKQFNGR